jgi:uncharacterized membrane protein HdeD (DUF308 family)
LSTIEPFEVIVREAANTSCQLRAAKPFNPGDCRTDMVNAVAMRLQTGIAHRTATSTHAALRRGDTMLTDSLKTAYNRSKWALLLRGLLGIALGVFILARPLESVAAFALVIAIWAVVDGIANIVHSFDLRSVIPYWGLLLASGIVSLLFGAAALYYYPALSLNFAVLWAAWWLIMGGALGVYIALQARKADLPWGSTLTYGIIAVAAGILAMVYPGITLAALMGIFAGFGIISGVAMLVAASKMQAFQQDLKTAIRTPSRA